MVSLQTCSKYIYQCQGYIFYLLFLQEAASTRVLRSWSANFAEELAWTTSRWKFTKYQYTCSNFEDFDWCIYLLPHFSILHLVMVVNSRTWNVASVMQFPIDLEQYDRRENLKKSGLGKVRILWGIKFHFNGYGVPILTTWTDLLCSWAGHHVFVKIWWRNHFQQKTCERIGWQMGNLFPSPELALHTYWSFSAFLSFFYKSVELNPTLRTV